MKTSLENKLKFRKKKYYEKLKRRFVKNLEGGTFKERTARQKHQFIEKLKKLELQLGIKSSPQLKHWALALALGIIVINKNYAQDSNKLFGDKDLKPFAEKRTELLNKQPVSTLKAALAPTPVGLDFGMYVLGDSIRAEEIVFGDFDGDGDNDMLIIGSYNNGILYNNAVGDFSDFKALPIDGYSYDAVVADIDEDGELDILLGYENGSGGYYLATLMNNGDGSFTPENLTGYFRSDFMAVSDIDNDGDNDVVAYNTYNGVTDIFLNDGNENFSQNNLLGNSIALGDVNNDGYDDIIQLGGTNNTWIAYIGSENGTFPTEAKTESVSADYNSLYGLPLLYDYDSDNDLDILALQKRNTDDEYVFTIHDNDGSGNFTSSGDILLDVTYPLDLQLADIDNDGDKDIVALVENYIAGDWVNEAKILLNEGTGTFTLQGESYSHMFSGKLAIGDINSDDYVDIILCEELRTEAFLNDGLGSFSSEPQSLINQYVSIDSELADLDGDNDLDLIIGGFTQILLNNGEGYFAPGQDIMGEFDLLSIGVEVGDIDNDGDLDLALYEYGTNNMVIMQNDGDANFTVVQSFYVASEYGMPFEYKAVDFGFGDLDNDGDADLVMLNTYENGGYHYSEIFLNNGSGSFTSSGSIFTYYYSAGTIDLADIDSDGDTDILLGLHDGSSSLVFIYENDGNANFSFGQIINSDYEIFDLKAADMDNDGDVDIVETYFFGGAVRLNDGLQNFNSELPLLSGSSYVNTIVEVGDIDNDGDMDVAMHSLYFGTNIFLNDGVYFMHNTQLFTSGSYYELNNVMSMGDLDGDSDLDIFSGSLYESEEIWLNGETINQGPVANAGENITIFMPASTADLNGSATDAEDDVLTYQWEQLLGPNVADITSPGSASTAVSGLIEGTYVFELKVSDGKFTDTDQVRVFVDIITEHENNNKAVLASDLHFYPNPVTDNLYLKGKVEAVSITDLSGKTLIQVSNPVNSIDVSSLSQGVYILKLNAGNEVKAYSIIKE